MENQDRRETMEQAPSVRSSPYYSAPTTPPTSRFDEPYPRTYNPNAELRQVSISTHEITVQAPSVRSSPYYSAPTTPPTSRFDEPYPRTYNPNAELRQVSISTHEITVQENRDGQSQQQEDGQSQQQQEDQPRIFTSYYSWLCLSLCFFCGLCVGYLNTLPGLVIGTDGFLSRVAPTIWRRKYHTDVTNYCDFFDMRLLVVIASQHVGQLVGVLGTPYLCSQVGRRTTLFLTLLVMLLGTATIAWLPNTFVVLAAFTILNLGIGVASRVCPILISELSLVKYSIVYDIGSWTGVPLSVIVIYLVIDHQSWGWRVAYGGIAVILLFIMFLSYFLPETPNYTMEKGDKLKTIDILQNIEGRENVGESLGKLELEMKTLRKASYSLLLKHLNRAPLIITTISKMIGVASLVAVLKYYGPLLFNSANLSSSQSLYLPSLIISSIQLVSRIISFGLMKKIRKRKELLVMAGLVKIVSEAYIAGIFYETSDRFEFFKDPINILIPGCVYIAADAYLTSPFGWLEKTFSPDLKVKGPIFSAALDLFLKAIMSLITTIAFCNLGGKLLFFYIGFDFIVLCFILQLVPETTNLDMHEVWSSHRIWGRFVKAKDKFHFL